MIVLLMIREGLMIASGYCTEVKKLGEVDIRGLEVEIKKQRWIFRGEDNEIGRGRCHVLELFDLFDSGELQRGASIVVGVYDASNCEHLNHMISDSRLFIAQLEDTKRRSERRSERRIL